MKSFYLHSCSSKNYNGFTCICFSHFRVSHISRIKKPSVPQTAPILSHIRPTTDTPQSPDITPKHTPTHKQAPASSLGTGTGRGPCLLRLPSQTDGSSAESNQSVEGKVTPSNANGQQNVIGMSRVSVLRALLNSIDFNRF